MKNRAWRNLVNQNAALICCICGQPILSRKDVSKEHEPPLSRGGKRHQWKYAHKSCNNHKGALTAAEYQLYLALDRKRNGR